MNVGGMEHPMKNVSGRSSAEIRQPMFSRPNSTSYQMNNQPMYNNQRSYMPNHGMSQPFPRPGSSQNHVPMHANGMSSAAIPSPSPPIQHHTSQPMMMSPSPMYEHGEKGHMPRMAQNQSPYYPMMHGQANQYHPSGMTSPGMMPNQYHPSGMTSPGMMPNHGMYMQPNMGWQYNRMAQPRNMNNSGGDDNSNNM